jgi:ribose transport system ATP-binding protein
MFEVHMTQSGFTAQGICKRFLADNVLTDVAIEVGPGEVVALLGENGAGKSTLSAIIAGMLKPDTGSMTWQGKAYAPASPGEAIAAGIALIHQETRLLPDLTVAENVFVGHVPRRGGFVDRGSMNRRASEQLKRLGLEISPNTPVRKLKVAAQQQVEIAKALTLHGRLLILDEPTAALGNSETERLFEQIERLRGEGVSFIYISHRLDEIAKIANRIVVLRDGHLVSQHSTAKVATTVLVEEMVGRAVDRLFPPLDKPGDDIVLEVVGLNAPKGTFQNISFKVRAGEIFGIAGIVGAGRTELVRAISGIDPIRNGTVALNGQALRLRHPKDAIGAGLVLVPEDRKGEGLVLDQSIADNLALPSLGRIAKGGWLTAGSVQRFAMTAIARLGIKGQPRQLAARLSGGNQQKVVIAKWLARNPQLIILDEPTRGIDVGARAAIYEIIAALAREGMAIVVVSSDLEEVLGLAHRVMVLSRGRQRGVLDHAEADNVTVMAMATS